MASPPPAWGGAFAASRARVAEPAPDTSERPVIDPILVYCVAGAGLAVIFW